MPRRLIALLLMVSAWQATALAATFTQRLDALQSAADGYLGQSGDDGKRYPADLRRVAWLFLAGDKLPDALLILKPNRSDCAALGPTARRPCKALIVAGTPDGGFRVVTEFPLQAQPVLFGASGHAGFDTLYFAGTGALPTFSSYGLGTAGFTPRTSGITLDQARRDARFEIDDRGMPDMAAQRYAASYFDNARAMLSPFRLQVDTMHAGFYIPGIKATATLPEQVDAQAPPLAVALSRDLAVATARLPWPVSLEARIWGCPDWVVPRRFWENDDRRLGKLGICADPLVFARSQGLVRGDDEIVQAARLRMLQEVGIAYVLRIAPTSVARLRMLRETDAAAELTRLGTVAGTLIANDLGLQTPAQALAADALWMRIAETWFARVEQDGFSFLEPSSELVRFVRDLRQRQVALVCTLRATSRGAALAAIPPATLAAVGACPAELTSTIADLRAQIGSLSAP